MTFFLIHTGPAFTYCDNHKKKYISEINLPEEINIILISLKLSQALNYLWHYQFWQDNIKFPSQISNKNHQNTFSQGK